MRYRLLLILLLTTGLVSPVHAGIIFGRKKEKIEPKARVPELIGTLQADKDADKRARAAEELRNFDPTQFPEMIPALIAALQSDSKPAVRIEALQTLSRFRPVAQQVGEALEQALAADGSMRVRLQARSALLQYHWAGYRSAKKGDPPPLNTTREPPLNGSEKLPPIIRTTNPVVPGRTDYRPLPSAPVPVTPSTMEPPLAPVLPSTPIPVPVTGPDAGGPSLE